MSLARQIKRAEPGERVRQQQALLGGAKPAALAPAAVQLGPIAKLVQTAASTLATATTAAQVLDARDAAAAAYDSAKRTARLAKAKGAHDELIAKAHRVQADALDIEAAAKRRLADEYDAAQERGEVAKSGDTLKRGPGVPKQNTGKATAVEAGVSRKEVYDARRVRNAEKAKPGVVRSALDQALDAGQEPTRAVVNEAVRGALGEAPASKGTSKAGSKIAAAEEVAKPSGLDAIIEAWTLASPEDRDAFVAYLRACGYRIESSAGMASGAESHSGPRNPANSENGHVDRSAGARPSGQPLGAEPHSVESGVAIDVVEGLTPLAARGGDKPLHSISNPRPTPSPEADRPATLTSSPTSPAAHHRPRLTPEQVLAARPHCRHADDLDRCTGIGREHCRDCRVEAEAVTA